MVNVQKIVSIAIPFDTDQNILISRRNDDYTPDANDKWALIGGKTEYGENPETALIREFREETGLEIQSLKLLPKVFTQFWTNKHGEEYQVILLVYSCSIINPPKEVKPREDKISELRFISKNDLNKYDFISLDAEIIEYFFSIINQK